MERYINNTYLDENGKTLNLRPIIKKIVKDLIVDEYDHSLVLNEKMNIDKSQFDFMNKLIIVPFQPTCELLLGHYAKLIKEELPSNIELHSLMLRETPTSYAEWFAEDNE